jgi:hypothetical protein
MIGGLRLATLRIFSRPEAHTSGRAVSTPSILSTYLAGILPPPDHAPRSRADHGIDRAKLGKVSLSLTAIELGGNLVFQYREACSKIDSTWLREEATK